MKFPFSEFNVKITSENDVHALNETRTELIKKNDKSLLNETDITLEYDRYNSVFDGRYRVVCEGVPFDCFFKQKKQKKLYVFLSGAKTASGPEFKRWSYYTMLDGSMLNIADPMYQENEDLMLGWYYGKQNQDYRIFVVEIVKRTAEILDIKSEDIVFISSSGGGAAILECAAMIEGSTAVSINPQIDLDLYFYARTFKEKLGIDFNNDPFKRSQGAYWIKSAPNTRFVLIVNQRSQEDLEQLNKFKKQINISTELHYGINVYENVVIWLYSADNEQHVPHSAQEDKPLFLAIKNLIDNLDTDLTTEERKTNYLIISELWEHIWALKSMLNLSGRTAACLEPSYKQKEVAFLDCLFLKKSASEYNAAVIFKSLKPRSRYKIHVGKSELREGTTEIFVIGLKDNMKGRTLIERTCVIGDACEFEILTGSDTKNMEIKVYAGNPGKTAGNEMVIKHISISLLE